MHPFYPEITALGSFRSICHHLCHEISFPTGMFIVQNSKEIKVTKQCNFCDKETCLSQALEK